MIIVTTINPSPSIDGDQSKEDLKKGDALIESRDDTNGFFLGLLKELLSCHPKGRSRGCGGAKSRGAGPSETLRGWSRADVDQSAIRHESLQFLQQSPVKVAKLNRRSCEENVAKQILSVVDGGLSNGLEDLMLQTSLIVACRGRVKEDLWRSVSLVFQLDRVSIWKEIGFNGLDVLFLIVGLKEKATIFFDLLDGVSARWRVANELKAL